MFPHIIERFFSGILKVTVICLCIACMLKVQFSSDVSMVTVLNQLEWADAYQEARCGLWEQYARDRERFSRHIHEVDSKISWVLNAEHRASKYHYIQTCIVPADNSVVNLFPS